MSYLAWVIVSFLTILFILLLLWKKTISRFPCIPFAPTIPILGSVLHLKSDSYEFYKQLRSFSVKYDYLYVIWLSIFPSLQIGRADYAEVILSSNEHITKAYFYEFMQVWLGTGLLLSTGKKWKRRRQAITPTFNYFILDKFQNVILEHTNILVSKLKILAERNVACDVQTPISLAMLDIICETAMGVSRDVQNENNSNYVEVINKVNKELERRQKSPWLWSDFIYPYTLSGRNFFRNLKILHLFTTDVINDRIKSRRESVGEDNRCKVFLDMLLDLYDEGEIDVDGIREEVDTFMFAGHDTTAAALSWTLYCLGNNPDVQRKLHSEIDRVSKEEGDLIEKIKNVKYLEYVIKETLRLHPPVPIIGRSLKTDTKVENMTFPAGTQMLVEIFSLHTNPEYWDKPLAFYPERFGEEKFLNRHIYSYIPFSAGPRNCIGQKFAMLEEKILLYHIMLNFEIFSTQKTDNVRTSFAIVQKSENGLYMKFNFRR